MRKVLSLLVLVRLLVLVTANEESNEVHFTNSWAVHLDDRDPVVVNELATRHGFVNKGQIGSLPGYYHFVKRSVGERRKRSLENHTESLRAEPQVKWVEQQRILERSKRHVIPGEDELVARTITRLRPDEAVTIRDPFYKDQWYLQNIGQSSGPAGIDINVLPVWGRGYSGKGVVVSILDDGVDHTHPDLKRNYDPDASFDFNDFDPDPKPNSKDPQNCHGTKCAGEVAAEANNGICGVGVSFNASIGGIRMLDGKLTDTIEGSSLSYRADYIDIYSCCWGPKDDGKRFGKPGTLASKALHIGAERGRGGKGSIFVWATGNGGMTDDDCNCDGYTTSIYTISIGAISDHGLSTYYTETCASTLAVTFSGGSHREAKENKIVTTGLNHKCTKEFKGTSSAAPLAAGMLALVLEANPTLTWRDVQHIIVETSQQTSLMDEGWKRNGAGKLYNHKFGFGRLDVMRMVERALTWRNVGKHRTCRGAEHMTTRFIPFSGSLILSANTSACTGSGSEIRKVEHVQVVVTLRHRHRGHLSMTLISPSGTRSELLTTRRNDHSNAGLTDWVFMTVHCWGEDPKGSWTLIITDNNRNTREHHVTKAKHGDFEDVVRIVMDDTEKQGPWDKNRINEYDHKTAPPGIEHKGDHIFKSMEDTTGELVKGDQFAEIQKKASKAHWKHHDEHKIRHKVVSKILKKLRHKKFRQLFSKLGKNNKNGAKRHRRKHTVRHHHSGVNHNRLTNEQRDGNHRRANHHQARSRELSKHRKGFHQKLSNHREKFRQGKLNGGNTEALKAASKFINEKGADDNQNVNEEEFGAALDAALALEEKRDPEMPDSSTNSSKPTPSMAAGALEIPKDAPLEAKIAIQALENPAIAKIFGINAADATKMLLPSSDDKDNYTSEVNIQMKIKKAHNGGHGEIPVNADSNKHLPPPEIDTNVSENTTAEEILQGGAPSDKQWAVPVHNSTVRVTSKTTSNMVVSVGGGRGNDTMGERVVRPRLPALVPVGDIYAIHQGISIGLPPPFGQGARPAAPSPTEFPDNEEGEFPNESMENQEMEPPFGEEPNQMSVLVNQFPMNPETESPTSEEPKPFGVSATQFPINPGTGSPVSEEPKPSGVSATQFPMNPETESPTSEEPKPNSVSATQFPINPESGSPMSEEPKPSGVSATQFPINPETGSPISEEPKPFGMSVSQFPINPDTGSPTREEPPMNSVPSFQFLNKGSERSTKVVEADQRAAEADAVVSALEAVRDGTLENTKPASSIGTSSSNGADSKAGSDAFRQSTNAEQGVMLGSPEENAPTPPGDDDMVDIPEATASTSPPSNDTQVTVVEEAKPTGPYAGIPGEENVTPPAKNPEQDDVQVTTIPSGSDDEQMPGGSDDEKSTLASTNDIQRIQEELPVQSTSGAELNSTSMEGWGLGGNSSMVNMMPPNMTAYTSNVTKSMKSGVTSNNKAIPTYIEPISESSTNAGFTPADNVSTSNTNAHVQKESTQISESVPSEGVPRPELQSEDQASGNDGSGEGSGSDVGSGSGAVSDQDRTGNANQPGSTIFLKTDKRPTVGSTMSMIVATPEVTQATGSGDAKTSDSKTGWKTLDCNQKMNSEVCERWRRIVSGVRSPMSVMGGEPDMFENAFRGFGLKSDVKNNDVTNNANNDVTNNDATNNANDVIDNAPKDNINDVTNNAKNDVTDNDATNNDNDVKDNAPKDNNINDVTNNANNDVTDNDATNNANDVIDNAHDKKDGMKVKKDDDVMHDDIIGSDVTPKGDDDDNIMTSKDDDDEEAGSSAHSTSGAHANVGNEPVEITTGENQDEPNGANRDLNGPEGPQEGPSNTQRANTDVQDSSEDRSYIEDLPERERTPMTDSNDYRQLFGNRRKFDRDSSDAISDSDDNRSEDRFDRLNLDMLQEALKLELANLASTPEQDNSNREMLRRVKEDIRTGNIRDLEKLESEIRNDVRDSRRPRSDDNGSHTDDSNDDSNMTEKRRLGRSTSTSGSDIKYNVYHGRGQAEYGEGNSGILESWSLVLYGTG